MADILRTSSAWLESMRKTHRATSIVYSTEDGDVTIADATVGSTTFVVTDGNGMLVTVVSRDFLIAPADLAIDGDQVDPAPGHRIVEGGLTYEVSRFGDEPCWRWTDQFQVCRRVHTKQVAAAEE